MLRLQEYWLFLMLVWNLVGCMDIAITPKALKQEDWRRRSALAYSKSISPTARALRVQIIELRWSLIDLRSMSIAQRIRIDFPRIYSCCYSRQCAIGETERYWVILRTLRL